MSGDAIILFMLGGLSVSIVMLLFALGDLLLSPHSRRDAVLMIAYTAVVVTLLVVAGCLVLDLRQLWIEYHSIVGSSR